MERFNSWLGTILRRERESYTMKRLRRMEAVLHARHLRDAEERARLWNDLTMLRQQLAIARRTEAQDSDD